MPYMYSDKNRCMFNIDNNNLHKVFLENKDKDLQLMCNQSYIKE